jgi:hypothetical protein
LLAGPVASKLYRMGHRRRTLKLYLILTLVALVVWGMVYAYDQGLNRRARAFVIDALEKQGVRTKIGRLTIDPFYGLTARDVHFYSMTSGNRKLASFSKLELNIDLARLMDRKTFIGTIRLNDAELELPVNPDDPASELVQLHGVNARVHVDQDKVTIAQAQANVAGLDVNVRGTLELPPKRVLTPSEAAEAKKERMRQWEEMKKRRGALQQVVQFLDRLKSAGEQRPKLNLEINGPLRDFRKVDVALDLKSGPFLLDEFKGDRLELVGELRDSVIRLKKLELGDRVGAFKAEALWNPWEDSKIAFAVDSSMDLPALTQTLASFPLLREMVFYSPPKISVSGDYFPDKPWTENDWPLEVVGSIDCEREISSRGVIFDGFHADIGLKQGDFFLRNVALKHRSGSATGKFLRTKAGGVRYHVKWGMELKNVLPFLPDMEGQDWFNDFAFSERSFVDIEVLGAGVELSPASWSGSAHVDLRDFSHRDVYFKSVSAEATVAEGNVICRNVLVQRPEGEVKAAMVNIFPSDHRMEIIDAHTSVFPAPIMRCINTNLEPGMKPYTFSKPPKAIFNGTFFFNDSNKSFFAIDAQINDPIELNFTGVPYQVQRAKAKITQKQNILTVAADALTEKGLQHPPVVQMLEAAPVSFAGDFRVSRLGSPVNRWKLEIPRGPQVNVTLGGKTLPVKQVQGTVAMDLGSMDITGVGNLVGGSVNAELHWDKVSSGMFKGEVLAARLGYGELNTLLNPAAKPANGYLTTAFRFTGGSELETLNGTGELLLEDNDIFSVPLLGPLSGLLSAVLPLEKVIYSTARRAACTIQVNQGTLKTTDFKAQTPAFELNLHGDVHLPENQVDLTARMNVRGIPGILLFPVSKIMEYEARGTLQEPGWAPKILPNRSR